MMNFDNEVPKYIKKKKSSVSKSKEKSKHKHIYADCLLIGNDRKPHKASYCKICGKIGDVKFFETEKTDHETYKVLNSEEAFKKYKDLPLKQIKDIFQKYVPVDVEE